MSASLPHRIRRQCWRVKAPSQEAAFALRQQLHSQWETALLPAFEQAFNALGTGDEVVRIPRLELNLKLAPTEDFIGALTNELRTRLAEVLQEVVVDHPGQAGVDRRSAYITRRQTLLHYLATGQLEWHAHGADPESVARALHAEASQFSSDGQALVASIAGPWPHRIAAAFRFLQLFPADARHKLLPLAVFQPPPSLSDTPPETAAQAMALIPAILRHFVMANGLSEHLRLRVQAALLALREEDLIASRESQLLALLHECQQQTAGGTLSIILDAVLHALTHQATLASSPVAGSAVIPGRTPASAPPHLSRRELGAPPERPVAAASLSPENSAAPPSNAVTPGSVAFSSSAAIASPGENMLNERNTGYPAGNAGLALLHPFLSRLFDATGIAPANSCILPAAALPRAAAMLHWLATGREEIYEFELTTIKVMLGLTPEDVLLTGASLLSEADRLEADTLLAAAIAHWGALGNSGASALRVSFLQRQGLLRDIGTGWQLQLESESFDLLLGKLPWGISIVRLPWMTRPIFTEWPMP
ncbi:MAG TPA: contractile injection system tape measure protein [Gallionella sp.]|nr:contractile injection system tape measure protein [Gallionella sp.]